MRVSCGALWRCLAIAIAGFPGALPLPGKEPAPLERLRVVPSGPVGPPAMRVDLVIVGEGYTVEDLKRRGSGRSTRRAS